MSTIEERLERIEKYLQKNMYQRGDFETIKAVSERVAHVAAKNAEWMAKPTWARFIINMLDLFFLDITYIAYNFIPVITFLILVASIYANPDKISPPVGWISLVGFYSILYTIRNSLM